MKWGCPGKFNSDLTTLDPKQQVDRWGHRQKRFNAAGGALLQPARLGTASPALNLPRPDLWLVGNQLFFFFNLFSGQLMVFFIFIFYFFISWFLNDIPYCHILKIGLSVFIAYCIVVTLYNRYLTYPWKHVKWSILIGSVASRVGVPKISWRRSRKHGVPPHSRGSIFVQHWSVVQNNPLSFIPSLHSLLVCTP